MFVILPLLVFLFFLFLLFSCVVNISFLFSLLGMRGRLQESWQVGLAAITGIVLVFLAWNLDRLEWLFTYRYGYCAFTGFALWYLVQREQAKGAPDRKILPLLGSVLLWVVLSLVFCYVAEQLLRLLFDLFPVFD